MSSKAMRAIDVAQQLPAGSQVVAKIAGSDYGIASIENRRGFLYVTLSADGVTPYPGGGNGTVFFLPGSIRTVVGSVEVPTDGSPVTVNLGESSAATLVTVRFTMKEAHLVRHALAMLVASESDLSEVHADSGVVEALRKMVPGTEVVQ